MPELLTNALVASTPATIADAPDRDGPSARPTGLPAVIFSDLAGGPAAATALDSALAAITAAALVVVPGAGHAGIVCPAGDGRLRTRASSSVLVDTLDLLQGAFRQGPCVGLRQDTVTRVVDITTETRWPRFTAAAARLGVGSMLSIAFRGEHDALGALNLYATTAAAFTIDDEIVAAVLAGDAAAMLAGAAERGREPQTVTERGHALAAAATRGLVRQAAALLMARDHVTAIQACEVLYSAAQQAGHTLIDVAQGLISESSSSGAR